MEHRKVVQLLGYSRSSCLSPMLDEGLIADLADVMRVKDRIGRV